MCVQIKENGKFMFVFNHFRDHIAMHQFTLLTIHSDCKNTVYNHLFLYLK